MNLCETLKSAVLKVDEQQKTETGYDSTFSAAKRDQLQKYLEQAENGVSAGELLRQAQADEQRFAALEAEEEGHPTFDWYGEHYWEVVYMGMGSACKQVAALLKPFVPGDYEP